MKFFQFSGLAPEEGVTAQDQRNEFALQLSNQTNLPEIQIEDWSKLFQLLSDKTKIGRVIILLDEITWMAHDDPTFLSKLKNAWDLHFKHNPKLILIICGSVSAWIEKNILSSTAFFGRISLHLTLSELPIYSCNQLLEELGFRRSSLEKLIYLSVCGGVPWYIDKLSIPKRYSVHPVLIHCNEISDELQESEYFYRIINFSDLLLKTQG